MMLDANFFDRDAQVVAKDLLGKVIHHKDQGIWLAAAIIETEAYYLHEKGSHSSLGFTEKRKALFMPPGTIYMYYARGKDSLNISCQGAGNAVLIKSAIPYPIANPPAAMIAVMQHNNPGGYHHDQLRPIARLCSGQTLLCRALGLKVTQWDQKTFEPESLYLEDTNYKPPKIIQTTRLGIPAGRDEHLEYRFIDFLYVNQATNNPLTKRKPNNGYKIISLCG